MTSLKSRPEELKKARGWTANGVEVTEYKPSLVKKAVILVGTLCAALADKLSIFARLSVTTISSQKTGEEVIVAGKGI